MSDLPAAQTLLPAPKPVVPFRTAASIAVLIVAVAGASIFFFYTHGLTDIYGDALTHMEGARRIFDSLTPGLDEIGSVWLPLYHLLAAPLAINNHLWRTGLAGSLISAAAFCGSAWLLFRLGLEMNGSITAGIVALAGFMLCPNMLYAASTPLTEPLAIFWAVFLVYALFRYQASGSVGWVTIAAVAAFLGTLTRYDEWFVLPFAALFVLLARSDAWQKRLGRAVLFAVVAGTGPFLWLLHNAYRYGNALQFYNGPYSAQAIYSRQIATTGFRYPTDGSLLVSAHYYLEDVKLVAGPWLLELAALGLVAWLVDRRLRSRRAAALLLLVPLPFYIQAMAHSAVPIYVPTLFPFSYYNLRYGLELLPALAILASFLLPPGLSRSVRLSLLVLCLAVFGAQGLSMLSKGVRNLPLVTEGIVNSPCKLESDRTLVRFFERHYDGERILMIPGEWPCVFPRLGIPYRKTLSESNRKYWLMLPSGPQKLVRWIVRGNGDAVDHLMRAYPASFRDFEQVYRESFPGQQSITIYRRVKG